MKRHSSSTHRSERGAAFFDLVIAFGCSVLIASYVSAATTTVEEKFACAAYVLGGGTDALGPDWPTEGERPCRISPPPEEH